MTEKKKKTKQTKAKQDNEIAHPASLVNNIKAWWGKEHLLRYSYI